MFAGTALSVRLFVCAGLSLFIICGPYLSVVVCVFYAYNLTEEDTGPEYGPFLGKQQLPTHKGTRVFFQWDGYVRNHCGIYKQICNT